MDKPANLSKGKLAITLSKLADFSEQDIRLEQYSTPSQIAAEWLWNAHLLGDLKGKVILDAACGPGFLGLGALLLGAAKVLFVDINATALELAKKNYETLQHEYPLGEAIFLEQDIATFTDHADVVLQNPPFGTKIKHHDKVFLEAAMHSAPVIYSMHKLNTEPFVQAITADHGFTITHHWKYDFPIKHSQTWHTKPVRHIEVGVWRMQKNP